MQSLMATQNLKASDSKSAAGRPSSLPLSRGAAAGELACLVLCIEAVMWIVPLMPNARAAYAGLVFVIIVLLAACHARDRLSVRELGFRLDNLPRALRRILLPLCAF